MDKNKHEIHDLNMYLKVAGVAALGVLTLFLVAKTVNEAKTYITIGENPSEISKTINVNGHAEITALPDVATFSWTTTEEGKTVQDAQDKSAEKSNKAIAYLESQGVPRADISTGGFSTSEKYSSSICNYESARPTPCPVTSEVVGYTTYQTVSVKVRNAQQNSKKVSQYIAEIGKMGVKTTDVSYTFDNPTNLKVSAQEAAIYNAHQNAERLAKSLGVKLGEVIGYYDNNSSAYEGYGGMAMSAKSSMMDARAPIAPDLPSGDRTISSDVVVTYSIR
ncbi:MAG: hypothetical protein RL094_112 [Candidatus Parcubacteria bacterium]|jgi:uncharacterized protein YggE